MEADGGNKILPRLSAETLCRLVKSRRKAAAILDKLAGCITSKLPSNHGFPSQTTQSNYYPGSIPVTRDEATLVSQILEAYGLEPENTRLQKTVEGGRCILHVLQASTVRDVILEWQNVDGHGTAVRVERGDHAEELSKICISLLTAREYSADNTQAKTIDKYVESFRYGSLLAYRDSQKLWVTDKSPTIETFIGFVEPYRDPHGVRGEWQGIVCISDPIENLRLKQLVDNSDTFICLLPWAVPGLNGGKGPFEKDLFNPPDFASVHGECKISSAS